MLPRTCIHARQLAALTKLSRVSVAFVKMGQNLFDLPALTNGYATTGLARPAVDALSGTPTKNDFRLVVGGFALG